MYGYFHHLLRSLSLLKDQQCLACKVPEWVIAAWTENGSEKETVSSQETGISKGQMSVLLFC